MNTLLFAALQSSGAGMSLFTLLIVLALLGVGVWALTMYIPMAPGFKRIITIVAVVVAVYLVLQFFGIWDDIRNI